MKVPRHAFREYDIRAVADRDLGDEVVEAIGATFARTLRSGQSAQMGARGPRAATKPPVPVDADPSAPLRVAVGRDGRLTGERIFSALARGLCREGADVIALPVGPTPLLYFAAHHLETAGAVMITASHNPAPDNGFKMMRGTASFWGDDIRALADHVERDDLPAHRGQPGAITTRDLEPAYIETVRAAARLPDAASCGAIKVVVDGGNGSAGPLGLATLRALGFDPDPLFCDIDGRFPNHHPDPTVPENLVALRERVLSTGALLGIAWDGDGDRLGVLDETGEPVWGDKLMILFSRALLAERPGATILGEVKCSETLYADVARHGGRPIVWKTGHSIIKTKMKEEKALLAGEMSGHVFFADRYFGYDDAIYASVRLLEILVREKKGLRELLADVPQTFATPEIRVDCGDEIKFDVVRGVLAHYRAGHRVLDIDGARVDFGDGAWGLCRASNTQPALVLRFEAGSSARLDEIRRDVEKAVADAIRQAQRAGPAS
jgi:phosphomannomutase/phosphoglucomutase